VAGLLEHGAQAAAPRKRDHRVLAQRADGDRLAPAERVAAANAEEEGLDGDDARMNLRWERLGAQPNDAGIHLAVGDRGEQRLVVEVGERDRDRRVGAIEVPERLGEAAVDGPGDADRHSSVEEPAQGRDRVAAPLGRVERGARVRQERLARRG
jgi:hypothetical protein